MPRVCMNDDAPRVSELHDAQPADIVLQVHEHPAWIAIKVFLRPVTSNLRVLSHHAHESYLMFAMTSSSGVLRRRTA